MRRRLGVALVLVVLLAAVATERLFVHPSVDAVRPVDAVVLFAGGRGERLELAEQLMDDGVAPVLVVPNGLAPEWPAGNAACTSIRPWLTVAAALDVGPLEWASRVAHEWLAWSGAMVDRAC